MLLSKDRIDETFCEDCDSITAYCECVEKQDLEDYLKYMETYKYKLEKLFFNISLSFKEFFLMLRNVTC